MDDAAFIASLEDALRSDTAALRASAPAARFEELAVLAVAIELANGGTISEPIATLVRELLRAGSLVERLEKLTVEGRLELVELVTEEVEQAVSLSLLEETCLAHARDFARWGWDDDLAARVPLLVGLLLDAVDEDSRAPLMFALAALKAWCTRSRPRRRRSF
jgi:hypothetical protein